MQRHAPIAALVALLGSAAPAAAQTFDHSAFDSLLRKHVANGLVDYDAFGRAPAFAAYLETMAQAKVETLPPTERLAFWINAYNAYTIELVNRHRERESIRNINKTAGLIKGHGPWRERLVKAGGATYHLDHVEHEIVRKEFEEPRIHFALVCAAVSCPPLRAEAYTGASLDSQLDDQARAFLLRSPTLNRVDAAKRVAHLSPIIADWYRGDFGGTDAAITRWLARFWPAGPERRLLESGTAKVVATPYDWSLNRKK